MIPQVRRVWELLALGSKPSHTSDNTLQFLHPTLAQLFAGLGVGGGEEAETL